jgi:DNA-binding IclR family transcriptional regulator
VSAGTGTGRVADLLGVTVFSMLVDRAALSVVDDRVELGPNDLVFWDFGVDPTTVDADRRKLATACLDRGHRLPHLGGALGAAVLSALERQELVERVPGSRELVITGTGRRKLPALVPGWA